MSTPFLHLRHPNLGRSNIGRSNPGRPNLGQTAPEGTDWAARLIPGTATNFTEGRKKPPQSVKLADLSQGEMPWQATRANNTTWGNLFLLVVPSAVQKSWDGIWSKVAADFALIALNWLFLGALGLQLRAAFPQLMALRYASNGPTSLLGIALLNAVLITLAGHWEELYVSRDELVWQSHKLARAVGWSTLLLCAVMRLQGSPAGTSSTICLAGVLNAGTLLAWRWLDHKRGPAIHHHRDARNVLIVGSGEVARRIAAYIKNNPDSGRSLCGFLDDEHPMADGVLGRVRDLAQLARAEFVDEVILAAPYDRENTLRVAGEARKLRLDVQIVPDLYGCELFGNRVEELAGLPVFCLHKEQLPSGALFVKRAMDIAGASLAFISLPVLALIAAIIKLDSDGPVIYAALRAGRKGRPFRCYKFRTMVSNADDLKGALRDRNERSGPFFKIADDPRVTRVGRLLRRYSIDELPQFWNVLTGEMSLVGPRPHPLDDHAAYQVEHLARLDVKPGITGLWQVSARRDPSFQRGIELDREYIRNWSIWLDLKILCRTFLVVIRGSGQ